MKKKMLKMVAIMLSVTVFTGCGAAGTSSKTLDKVIPDIADAFPDAELKILDDPEGEYYTVHLKPYTREQWLAFVDAAKAMGYTNTYWDDTWEGEEVFGATIVTDDDNNGKYWFYTYIDQDEDFIDVEASIAASYKKEHPEEFTEKDE